MDVSSGRQAIELFKKEIPDAVLLDLKMPGMDGIETMQELKRIDPDIPIIIITSYGDVDAAVGEIKLGAYDFIVKPPKFDRLLLTLKRAIEKMQLEKAVKKLNTAVGASLEWLLGKSYPIKKIIGKIRDTSHICIHLSTYTLTNMGCVPNFGSITPFLIPLYEPSAGSAMCLIIFPATRYITISAIFVA